MLNIKTFSVNPLEVNCYVVSDEKKDAVIIDCGCFATSEWNDIKKYVAANGLTVVHLLNTHLHFDHVMGNIFAYNDLGIGPKACASDLYIYNKVEDQLRMFMGMTPAHIDMPKLEQELRDGDTITFGSHQFMVLQTPGHTPGGVCFYCKEEGILFTGDTLFRMSIGRTDLPGGSYEQIVQSINDRLAILPGETIAYPGHGPSTTIADECKYNPYIRN